MMVNTINNFYYHNYHLVERALDRYTDTYCVYVHVCVLCYYQHNYQ